MFEVKPTACILLEGSSEQKEKYIEKYEKFGDIILAKTLFDLNNYLVQGKYVIVNSDDISLESVVSSAFLVDAELVGVSFDKFKFSKKLNRKIIGGISA